MKIVLAEAKDWGFGLLVPRCEECSTEDAPTFDVFLENGDLTLCLQHLLQLRELLYDIENEAEGDR